MGTDSGGKDIKTTTATSPADGTSKNAPTQTTNAAVGGGGTGTANPDDKKDDAKDDEKGDPVSVVKGTVVENVLDIALPGLVPFHWRRRYSSADFAKTTPLGRGGWTHDYHQWIEPQGDGFCLRNFDGVDLSFGPIPDEGQGASLHRGRRLLLHQHGDRFEIVDLATRGKRTYAPLRPGGRAFLRSIADAYGNQLTLHYENERLVRITDTAGREVHLRHDDQGRICAIEVDVNQRSGLLFTYDYTNAGELASAANALGQAIRYAYDGKHRIVQKWLRNGFSVHYAYDPVHGRVARTWGDGGFHQVGFTYDFDKQTTTTHDEPQPRVYHWDADGNILRQQTLDGRHVIERKWDSDHLLLSEKNAAGEQHAYDYDDQGFLIEHTDPAGNVTLYEREDGLLRRIVRPNGNVRVYEYDGYGGLWAVTMGTGLRYSVDRDRWGRIAAVYGPDGLMERLEYDMHHNLARVTGPQGQVTAYQYDDLGRAVLRQDPLGRATRLAYDAADNITSIVYPDDTQVDFDYDGMGKVTRIHKPGGDLAMDYIGTGVLARAVMEDGGQWSFTYDREEKPVRIDNPKNEQYEFRYDRTGRIVEERTFDGRTIRYGYDLSGRLHRIDQPDDTFRTFDYDPLGNVILEESPHGPIVYKRDQQGLLIEATLDEGPVVSTVVFERDPYGRVVAETQDDQTIRYEYDIENRVAARTLPSGQVTRYGYDLDGMLATVQHEGQTIALQRDAAGQERLRHVTGSLAAIASSYDTMGRLVTQDAVAPTTEGAAAVQLLLRRRWTYDALGRLQSIDDARWGPAEFFYDKAHNLVRANRGKLDETFDYDPAGGLIRALQGLAGMGERWSVRQGDVLARTEKAIYEYDACHRRTKKTELHDGKPTDRITEYVWDCRDRLREVRLPGGDIVRYFYDAFGRRTRKIIYASTPPDALDLVPPSRVTTFLWEGDVLAQETDTERGIRGFVHEPNTFRPILQIEQGEVFLYVLDHLGTPRELLDVDGRVVWAAAYKAYGQLDEVQRDPQPQREQPVSSPFRLLGQYADEETGLHATRFRYWDPEVGRWCSPDPMGILAGAKLLGFPGAPTIFVDPFGLGIDWSQIPDTPGVYHITTPQGQYYTGSAYGVDGMRSRLSSGGHPAAPLMSQPGATIEFFEVDLGKATTKSQGNHIVRYFEQTEMDARSNTPIGRGNEPGETGSWNIDRAAQEKKMPAYKQEVEDLEASRKATKKVKNT